MQKIRTLIFHPALAPYRIDLFNKIADFLDLKIFFLRENLLNQKFDQAYLKKQLHCEYDFLLSGFDFKGRSFRWGISKIISEFNPEVIVTVEYSPITLWLTILKRFTNCSWGLVTWTADNVSMVDECGIIRKLVRYVILKNIDSLIVYSKDVKKRYIQLGYHPQKIFICSNLQNEKNFYLKLKQSMLSKCDIFSKFIGTKKRIILFVGRLVSIKGVDHLLKAFASVKDRISNVMLMIVGDGPEKNKLISLASELGIYDNVIFTGRLEGSELYACYLLGDLFVLPSYYESYGAVVNEALLAGMPVIVSSKAGASELILEGFNGHIFEPFDIERLTNLMIEELHKLQPHTKRLIIRQNLMQIKFEENVQEFIRAIRCAKNGNRIVGTQNGR